MASAEISDSEEAFPVDSLLLSMLEPIRTKYNLPAFGCAYLDYGTSPESPASEDGVVSGVYAVCGSRQWTDSEPVDENDFGSDVLTSDPWHLGSNTKAFTAVLVGMLIERGILDWNTSVWDVFSVEQESSYFPDLPETISQEWKSVTVEMLLSHCGGQTTSLSELVASLGAWEDYWLYLADSYGGRQCLVAALLQEGPNVESIGQFAYSNGGYVVLGGSMHLLFTRFSGAMAEFLTGRSWENLIQEEVARPLGLRHLGFGPPIGTPMTSVPWGHRGILSQWDPMSPPLSAESVCDNPAGVGPAGTIHASLPDWCEFVRFVIEGSRGTPGLLLRPETFRRLLPKGGAEKEYRGGWFAVHRDWAGDFQVLFSCGSNEMWYCMAFLVPERRIAVLVVTNGQNSDDRGNVACKELGATIMSHLLAHD